MSALGYGAAVTEAALSALSTRLGNVETAMPGKADMSMVESELAAKANESDLPPAVQCKRIQVAGASGVATWVFSPAFEVAPICAAIAETPTGASYINVATIVQGSTTTAQTQFVVQQVAKSITLPTLATALLGLVLTLFGFAPAGVYVNCFARRPS